MIKLIRSEKERIEEKDLINLTKEEFKKKISKNANIVAAVLNNDEIVLLDKEYSFLRVLNEKYIEIKTIGSRLGYISDSIKERIGFEFPEDLILYEDKIIISDSGNNRIIILSKSYKYIDAIQLPDSPFKFIYCKDDLLIVSDFFRSVFFISIKFGYIGKLLFHDTLDFETVRMDINGTTVKDEAGDIFNLFFEKTDITDIAEKFKNKKVLMKLLENKKSDTRGAIRSIIEDDEVLILEYIKQTGDDSFDKTISEYISKKMKSIYDDDLAIIKNIKNLTLEYFYVYRILNTKGDKESGNLIMEQKIFNIFEKIKSRRENFYEINLIKSSIIKNKVLKNKFETIIENRKIEITENIKKAFSKISLDMEKLDEESLLLTISDYWLMSDELKIVFPAFIDSRFYIHLLNNMFYNNLLKDYYFNISLLYQKNCENEKFYSYAEKELLLYSDKLIIMFRYVDILIVQKNYNRALQILSKNVDKNKEMINYRYYMIYKEKNELDKAFHFLKKEFELFPHKKELIPELLSFNMISKDEIFNLISSLKESDNHIIDVNYNTALALLEIGEPVKGEMSLDKELQLFPENKKAVLLKMRLMLKKIPDISIEEGIHNFNVLIDYLKAVHNDPTLVELFNYLIVLNFVPFSLDILKQLQSINWKEQHNSFREQIHLYISFHKFIMDEKMDIEIERFDIEEYLSSISCSLIGLNHFLSIAKGYFNKKQQNEGFALIESILKYNPGNKEVFEFLDSIS